MPKPQHFIDLERRYQETNSVSEYQRLWSIFNVWLVAHIDNAQDRQCIESFKLLPETQNWISRVINSAITTPHRVTDGLQGSRPRFKSNNVISKLFRECSNSNVIEPRINYPWRTGTELRVRQSNAITLSESEFVLAHRCHGNILYQNMAYEGVTFHQALEILGVFGTGCCFYRDSPNTDPTFPNNSEHYSSIMVEIMRTKPEISQLVELIDSSTITSITNDTIELMYNVRNTAVHGTLDYLDNNDNSAARAASDCLSSLLKDIIQNW